MCGICGIVTRGSAIRPEQIQRMQDALAHRGPDATGLFRNDCVALGFCRLSILDLHGGGQPLYNEDRTLVLVANGEIYNHSVLRERLSGRGHRFATGSDCEVLLHLFEEEDTSFVRHLRGMFAFALWDSRTRRLFLGRDRMGEKPLYLMQRGEQLIFASEMKSLAATGYMGQALRPSAVHDYFHFGFVPEPDTIIEGVRKVEAGHLLTIHIDSTRQEDCCYWRMDDAAPLDGDPKSLICTALDSIGDGITQADVPVGVALSGGIDSAVIAGLISRDSRRTFHAFSVGYPGRPAYDERSEASALADGLGMPFHEIELCTEQIVADFPRMNYLRDDPIADISGSAYHAIAESAARAGVPVLLFGQGADELFWGYSWTQQAARDGLCEAAAPLARFYERVPHYRLAIEGVAPLYSGEFLRKVGESDPARHTASASAQRADLGITERICGLYLRENGCVQADRLAMGASVESRLPFLDHHLVETVLGLRRTNTDVHLPGKAWLKAAAEELVPREVLERPKRGFSPPLGRWHRALFAEYGECLRDGLLVQSGILHPAAAENLSKGPFPEGSVIPLSFKALVLEMWCRAMFGGPPARVSQECSREDTHRPVCL